jgi:hypothetical protein
VVGDVMEGWRDEWMEGWRGRWIMDEALCIEPRKKRRKRKKKQTTTYPICREVVV